MSLFTSQEPSSSSGSSPRPRKRARTSDQENNEDEQKERAEASTGKFYESYATGFRFRPTDQELLLSYLKKKTKNETMPINYIPDIDLRNYSPEQLTRKYPGPYGENEWYFFVLRYRKYKNGSRPSRSAGNGYWKATGAEQKIYDEEKIVGYRTSLVFYVGPAQKGKKTDWLLQEFRVKNDDTEQTKRGEQTDVMLDQWVLCRMYKKGRAQNEETQEERVDNNDLCEADCQHSLPASGPDISNLMEPECNNDRSIVSYNGQGNPFGANEFSGLRNPPDEIGCSHALQQESTGLRNLVGENESGHALPYHTGNENLIGEYEYSHDLQHNSSGLRNPVGASESNNDFHYNYTGHYINPAGDQFVSNLSPQCGYSGNPAGESAPYHAPQHVYTGNPAGESEPNHAPQYSYNGDPDRNYAPQPSNYDYPVYESIPNHAPQCSNGDYPVDDIPSSGNEYRHALQHNTTLMNPKPPHMLTDKQSANFINSGHENIGGESVPNHAPQYSYNGDPVRNYAPQPSNYDYPVDDSIPNHDAPQYSNCDYPVDDSIPSSGNEYRHALRRNTTLMNPKPRHMLTDKQSANFINYGHENIGNSAKPISVSQPTNPTKDIYNLDSFETGPYYCDDLVGPFNFSDGY